MTSKKRLLKITAIVAGIVAFTGYFAFSTFLFSPLEADLEADVAALVPRDVDFYAARARNDEAFGDFPRLAVQDRIDRTDAWQTWIKSPEYADMARDMKLEQSLEQLAQVADQLPLGMQPQDIYGGGDLAVAGYFRGKDLAQADWCAYGRANWLAKLAVALLNTPDVIGLKEQGLTVESGDGWVALSGARLPRKLYIARIKDVVMVATQPELPQKARALEAQAFADSFYQSAIYFDHVQNADRNALRDEVELYVNTKKLQEALQIRGPLPNPGAQDFGEALLGRLVQAPAVKSVVGTLDLSQEFRLDLHGEFTSEAITPEMARIYRARGFDNEELLREGAILAPADAAFFAYLRAPTGDLLRNMVASMEPALRTNLEDLFRNTGKYPTLDGLVSELDGALRDRAAFIVRPNDYTPDPNGPPNDGGVVPAWALVLWPKNVDAVVALRDTIGTNSAKFGLQGRTPGEAGYFRNVLNEGGGFEIREFWSRFVPGTGMIATCNAGGMTIVSNSFKMLSHILLTATQNSAQYPRLADDPTFLALTRTMRTGGHIAAYVNPKSLVPVLRLGARRQAEDALVVDWRAERARLEDKVLRERFPGEKRGQLSPAVQEQVDAVVDPQLEKMERDLQTQQVPQLMAAQERLYTYASAMRAGMVMLRLDPKSFELSVRAIVPLPE